jgi:hypothetical protein
VTDSKDPKREPREKGMGAYPYLCRRLEEMELRSIFVDICRDNCATLWELLTMAKRPHVVRARREVAKFLRDERGLSWNTIAKFLNCVDSSSLARDYRKAKEAQAA